MELLKPVVFQLMVVLRLEVEGCLSGDALVVGALVVWTTERQG